LATLSPARLKGIEALGHAADAVAWALNGGLGSLGLTRRPPGLLLGGLAGPVE
jgi:hypothetical protein